MAATERNEAKLGKGIPFQEASVLIDTLNAVCLIKTVIEDPKSGKKHEKQGTGFLSKLDTPSGKSCDEIYGVVTNNHVLRSETDAKNALVTFEGTGKGKEVKLQPEIKFRTEMELDYTFVGVDKADIDGLAIQPILMKPEPELKKGENIKIIQHPKGGSKKYSEENILEVKKPYVFHQADTDRGSSGSPILTSKGLALIAVHCKGSKENGYNKGTLISEILKHLQEGSSSASNEVKQKEKSGSAAKKPEIGPFGEPGTSGVSSTSKTRKFKVKDGEPDDKELSRLAQESTLLRGKLGRELGVPQGYQEEIGVNHKGDAYEMTFQVLLWWRKNSSATSRYQELFDALTEIGCRDLAKKYCCC